MSLFNLLPPMHEKDKGLHPWVSTIRGEYANKIKYAHNSINNPAYPKKTKTTEGVNRVKFKVIGNRVAKEFIYCMHIVKALHKWRRKLFDAPAIRGTNSVEWPSVWSDLKRQYGSMAYCLLSQVVVLINDKLLGGEKELRDFVESKYIYHLTLDYYKEGVAQFASYIKSSGRPCAYMHISVDGTSIGTMIFMLYADLVPNTCENFLRLCKEKKGGYGGTPIHRIVKDGWIQCGGFGLKGIDLDCENFIVPHDRRGVLGMANSERHVDCATQFFILLQPAPWMEYKYVAFGQLIDGESTLQKIEKVPTWYESPTLEIKIYQAGILNLDCHDTIINKGTKEYIHSHIENLVTLGDSLYEELMQRVCLELEFRDLQRLSQDGGEEVEHEESAMNSSKKLKNKRGSENRHTVSFASDDGNNEFDVEMYEPEECSYKPASIIRSISEGKPEQPYYLPLTDIPYPGEVDSNYDLKKFIKGDYCLESDLRQKRLKIIPQEVVSYISEILDIDEFSSSSTESLESDEARELQDYVKMNADRLSFAGKVIKKIGQTADAYNLQHDISQFKSIPDEKLRKMRLVSSIYDDVINTRDSKDKKVSLSAPKCALEIPREIKRRQTGFVRPEDLEEIHIIHEPAADFGADGVGDARKVHISSSSTHQPGSLRQVRRPTGFIRSSAVKDSDVDIQKSTLNRLYDECTYDSDVGPTLKSYRPLFEVPPKNVFLLKPPNHMDITDDFQPTPSFKQSVQDVLNMQHGRLLTRKISSDYVKTIGHIENRPENSIRSVEYAKTRPALSISEYQVKNRKYKELLDQKFKPLKSAGLNG